MRYWKLLVISFVFALAIWHTIASSSEKFIELSKQDKCPVCGMFVYKYPNWIAQIIFKDGVFAVFDGPKDMFRYYFNISKYGKNRTKEDIAKIYATEYYTTEKVEAKDVYFVVGSDVYGPMGEELVPVKGRKEAEAFMREHKGRKILGFEQITPADIPGAMKMQEMQEHDKRH